MWKEKGEEKKIMCELFDYDTMAWQVGIELAYNERYYANLWGNMYAATREEAKCIKKESENLINYLLRDG